MMAEKKPRIEFVHWIVEHRNAVQKVGLDIYELMKSPDVNDPSKPLHRAGAKLVGAYFSLWRAVFLIPGATGTAPKQQAAREYISRVLLDNTLVYSDDVQQSSYSYGYYLNNARYRLKELCDERLGIRLSLLHVNALKTGTSRKPTRDFEAVLEILGLVVQDLQQRSD